MRSIPVRPLDVLQWNASVERRSDGSFYVRPSVELGEYPARLTDRLDQWAQREPNRTFLAERTGDGDWRPISYAEFRMLARRIAQALLKRSLNTERPIIILSGNDIEHALLAVAAMYAGIPYAPISPAYSLVSSDLSTLRYIFDLIRPGLVFATDGAKFQRALEAVVSPEAEIIVTRDPISQARLFDELPADIEEPELQRITNDIKPDSIAKILFTSGSTGTPKGVVNTHRMLCSNQEQMRTVFRFLVRTPPVLCDWLPWNHTFGGNHNFGLVLYNGGTMYIDRGRPISGAFEETVRNLRELSPNVYFNVPKGYEMLVHSLRSDTPLRERFFRNLHMMFYAAAGLSQQVWDALDELAILTCGERIRMLTGLGATETAPFALCVNGDTRRAGVVGLPAPGVELKLTPVRGKLEARIRGPNVTPGFWRREDLTRAALDEEGFYRMGDALRFIDPSSASRGFFFDGRISEDFKLSTGTWVSVGPLRTSMLLHFAPFIRDVVIAGHHQDEITALIFPDADALRQLGNDPASIRSHFQCLLDSFARIGTGSSTRIARAIVVSEPPALDAGEVTDKGSLNQAAVLNHRKELVADLYRKPVPAHVIEARKDS